MDMSIVKLTKEYYCSEDCRIEGCPKHTATLTWDTCSDWYSWDNGNGREIGFDRNELDTLIELLKEIDWR